MCERARNHYFLPMFETVAEKEFGSEQPSYLHKNNNIIW